MPDEPLSPPTDPFPLSATIGVTVPDDNGRSWVLLRLTDGTSTTELRLDPATATAFAASIAQNVAAASDQAIARSRGVLRVVSPGYPRRLVVPQPQVDHNRMNGGMT